MHLEWLFRGRLGWTGVGRHVALFGQVADHRGNTRLVDFQVACWDDSLGDFIDDFLKLLI